MNSYKKPTSHDGTSSGGTHTVHRLAIIGSIPVGSLLRG